MVFDNIYSRYCAPKRKKSHALAWIIGIIVFVSLIPLAIRNDKRKGEWGFASLLLYVSCRPSRRDPGKRELTVSVPGFTHLKSVFGDTGLDCCKKAPAPADTEEIDDLLDGDDGENDTDPKVVITEEQA